MALAGPGRAVRPLSPAVWESLGRADLEPTTCWDFPGQGSVGPAYGDPRFHGVTPAGAARNLIRRYTAPGDLIVDPMAGSGTVADVARALGRRAVSLDLAPRRGSIVRADARAWPLRDGSAALVVIDSPYSDNVAYSSDPRCLGRLSCRSDGFYDEMARVAREARRVLRPGGLVAWIISDEYRAGSYTDVGFRLWQRLRADFVPVDTVVLVRRGDRSATPMWEHLARRRNFYLRGFKYLFLLRKPGGRGACG